MPIEMLAFQYLSKGDCCGIIRDKDGDISFFAHALADSEAVVRSRIPKTHEVLVTHLRDRNAGAGWVEAYRRQYPGAGE